MTKKNISRAALFAAHFTFAAIALRSVQGFDRAYAAFLFSVATLFAFAYFTRRDL